MTKRRRNCRPEPPSHRLGRLAEDAAEAALKQQGYRILARNLLTRTCEFDLVALHGKVLVGVEVKARSHHGAPERAVDDRRLLALQQGLCRLAPHLAPAARLLRIDVIAAIPQGARFDLLVFKTNEIEITRRV